GAAGLREAHFAAPFRVYVQTDPVTVELQLARHDEHTWNPLAEHHVVVSYGENYGNSDCGVPLNGTRYLKTRQPIDLDLCPMAYTPESRYFTTIGNYRQTGHDIEYNGQVYYWSKHHEWEKFMMLQERTTQ